MRISAFRRLLRFAWLKSQTPSKLPGERVVKRKRWACLQPRFRVSWLQKPCQVLRVFCREDFFFCFAFALISPLDYNFLENSRGHCHSAVACRHWHLYFSSPGKGTFLKKRQLRTDAFSPMSFLSLCCLIIPSFYWAINSRCWKPTGSPSQGPEASKEAPVLNSSSKCSLGFFLGHSPGPQSHSRWLCMWWSHFQAAEENRFQ